MARSTHTPASRPGASCFTSHTAESARISQTCSRAPGRKLTQALEERGRCAPIGSNRNAYGAGDRLGPYEVLGEIGWGSFKTVLRARNVAQAEAPGEVALAVPHRQDPESAPRHSSESELMRHLRHPHIVRVYETRFLEDEGTYFVAMELVAGCEDETLAGRVLLAAARIAWLRGETEAAMERYRTALGIWDRLGNVTRGAQVLNGLGLCALQRGDRTAAADLFQQAAGRSAAANWARAAAANNLGTLLLEEGRYLEAGPHLSAG